VEPALAKAGGCRGCEGAVVQAPAPERPVTGGIATEAVLAQVLVSKYSDHLPLYRQAQIFARHGIDLDRSTPAFAGAGLYGAFRVKRFFDAGSGSNYNRWTRSRSKPAGFRSRRLLNQYQDISSSE
jgi:Transposase IS66 family